MFPFNKILCPTDFSDPSYEGLTWAIELAKQFGAELYIMHVIPTSPALGEAAMTFQVAQYEETVRADVERRFQELFEQRIPKEVKAHRAVSSGDAATEIVHAARDEHMDLIVIATHGLTGWRHLVFGSVAEKVVRLAECPVLTVRAPRG
jgi:nucleotide-binding universal stress UspA family protein